MHLNEEIEELKSLIRAGDRELFEDILANTVSRKIRAKINGSTAWVEKMNALMGEMNTSSGLKLSLRWRSRTAEAEDQLNTKELVELLKKDYRLMREDEAAKLSAHFRSKVEEARRRAGDSGGEKAMAMYVPLFSAVVAKYQGGRPDGRPPADLPGRGRCRRG